MTIMTMYFILILICVVPGFMGNTELKERGTRHSSKLSDEEVRVDDIMHILQGVCVYNSPKNNIKQLKKDTESDISVYKDVVALNKKLREELKWILQETKGFKEVSRIVNLLKLDMKGKCSAAPLPHATDCSEVKKNGKTTSGVYTIYPYDNKGVEVFCDMTTVGGGWTIMQKHSSSAVDFQRTWVEYEEGFGDPSGDLWLGNKILHELTSKHQYELRIELTDTSNNIKYASYKTFKIGDSSSKYKLTIGDYSGNAGDRMAYSNGMKFTTKDQDNDKWPKNCAVDNHDGPWWMNQCAVGALNRKYKMKPRWDGISVVKSVMMIRRL